MDYLGVARAFSGHCQGIVWAMFKHFKKLSISSKFLRASRGFMSKTVLVESEESNSDLRASGNRVT